MDLKEIVDLITIREYMVNSSNNHTIDRKTVNFMIGSLLLVDKKIINLLQSDEFKEYINYEDVDKAKQEAANANNIKSGLIKNNANNGWIKPNS